MGWWDCRQLNQAQGVILETLKEREKDRREELSAGGFALPKFKVSLASACSQAGGAQPPLSGELQAGQASIPSIRSHLRSARGGDVLPEGGYISRVPRSLQGLGGVLWNGIDLSQTPRHPLLPADHGIPERVPT